MTTVPDPNTPERQAIASLLDVVEELAQGLAAGQTPEYDLAEIVSSTFAGHRLALRELTSAPSDDHVDEIPPSPEEWPKKAPPWPETAPEPPEEEAS